ncbi:MAG: hypothetical protein M1826_001520 [Phylliscum demangeonii]|nr:MAG: hypothetical protein M1826_001520 [Phylliscum demangeonii]
MKTARFACLAATLSAVLRLALAQPVPAPPQPHSVDGDQDPDPPHPRSLVTEIGSLVGNTGWAAGMGALMHSGFTNRKMARAQAEKVAALDQLKTAQQQIDRQSNHIDRQNQHIDLVHDQIQTLMKTGHKLTQVELENMITTPQEHFELLLRCWIHQLDTAVRESRAATWPDRLGDDMWAKCIQFHPTGNPNDFATYPRPALDFKKAGAVKQKTLGLFQYSAAVLSMDRPLALVHSPAVQHQMRNLQNVGAAGMREVHALEKFGAREEGALQKAAVGFRAAGLRAGEV